MSGLIALILGFYLDIKHWFQIKRRRKFEKENNLPKSTVWHPLTKYLLIFFLILMVSAFSFFFFNSRNNSEKVTKDKLQKISNILEDEKKQTGKYPKLLKNIIRNNPLRQKITLDYWKNEFVYVLLKDSLHYSIISLGKDQKINTADDIKITNK